MSNFAGIFDDFRKLFRKSALAQCAGLRAPMTIRVAMWSGPRNLSTAMMRSFGTRPGHHRLRRALLRRLSQADRRSAADGGRGHSLDGLRLGERREDDDRTEPERRAGLVPKAYGAPYGRADWARRPSRPPPRLPDPRSVARRRQLFRQARRGPARHLGTARQVEFFDREADRLGHAPPVVDSADVLDIPKATLTLLCEALDIPFDRRC